MRLLREIRHRLGSLLMPFLAVFIIFYAYYHMLTGQHGLLVWYDLNTQVANLQEQNEALKSGNNLRAERIGKLLPNQADADFLDEQIRRNLSYARTDETVLFLN